MGLVLYYSKLGDVSVQNSCFPGFFLNITKLVIKKTSHVTGKYVHVCKNTV